MTHMIRYAASVLLVAILLPARVHAQAATPAPGIAARLAAVLDAPTRSAVMSVIDSAVAARLPANPLVAKALEGASRSAPGPRIVAAVRNLVLRLATARAALGAGASESDLVAAASAVQAGVAPELLARLRALRPRAPLAVPLVVLTDLVERGVRPDTAAGLVLTVARSSAGDDAFTALRRTVARDIAAGTPPSVAAAVRTQDVLRAVGSVGRVTGSVTTGASPASAPTARP